MHLIRRILFCVAIPALGASHSATRAQQTPAIVSSEPRPSFEVASIKPSKPDDQDRGWHSGGDRIAIENYSLRDLVVSAYGLRSNSQVLGGPDWLAKEHFDISAKGDDVEVVRLRSMTGRDKHKEWNLMMQSLLADRFGLKVSQGQKKIPVYVLVVAKSGIKLTPAAANNDKHNLSVHNTDMFAAGVSMETLADYLTQMHECDDRVVVDRTGLSGDYDFKLDWTRDRGDGVPSDARYPGIFTALREQLGLELKRDEAPVDVVIVDAAKKPDFD
jgi:uncharacterized protein (TIGR03435 family)